MSAGDWAIVGLRYTKLQAAYVSAVAVNASAVIADELRAGNGTMLRFASEKMDRLRPSGDLGVGVMTGAVTLKQWTSIAQVVAEGLASVMESCGEGNTFTRLWDEVVVPTAEDTADVIKDAAGGFGFGLGAAALFLAAFVAWRVIR